MIFLSFSALYSKIYAFNMSLIYKMPSYVWLCENEMKIAQLYLTVWDHMDCIIQSMESSRPEYWSG